MLQDEAESTDVPIPGNTLKRSPKDELTDAKRFAVSAVSSINAATTSSSSPSMLVTPKVEPTASKPIERIHADAVLNFLLRLACQVNDATPTQGNPGEQLSRRCVALLKMALKPDVWPQSNDLKLAWLDKVFQSVETPQPNYGNICTALELLTFLLGVMKKEHILASFRPLQKGLGACIANGNTKVIR